MKIQQISNSLFVLQNAVLELKPRDASFGVGNVYMAENDYLPHVRWGANDNEPNVINALIQKNNQVRGQLEALRDIIYGTGLKFFRRVATEGKIHLEPVYDEAVEQWAYETDLHRYIVASINQMTHTANRFTRWVWDVQRGWFRLEVSDGFMTRVGRPTTGRISEYHVNPYYGEVGMYRADDTQRISKFEPHNTDANVARIVTMHHSKIDIPGNPYYSYPAWWCAQSWIELANLIPVFHYNGIKNGYNIKYLIRMPRDYFDYEGKRQLDEKTVKKKWENFSEKLNSWMAGEKQVNKTMLIKYLRGADGKMADNVEVTPLKNEMSDSAYSEVWSMANQSIANAMGLLPTLAGVNPGKGNDSGSQIRVMAEFQQGHRTAVVRNAILEDVRHCLIAMGRRDIIPMFADVQLTTLDVNPTGQQAVVNHGTNG
jgi:hypothetical protein